MDLETKPLPFMEWLAGSGLVWLITVGCLFLIGLVGSFIVLAARTGPLAAGDSIFRNLVGSVRDLIAISPRRVYALARLAVQESLRRRVLTGFGIFVVVLLFAAWFLSASKENPARLYLSFVLTSSTYLVLALSLFLSAFSLPADIQKRTIYTIVTKPVRPSEVVLGRVLGFAAIGTFLLGAMGLVSYFFVSGALRHTHELSADDLREVRGAAGDLQGQEGLTSEIRGHRHTVLLDAAGNGVTDIQRGHRHTVTATERDGGIRYVLSAPQDQFHARVPVYGDLLFKDRSGKDATEGVNVGNERMYRSFIEGGTQAAAVWTFTGLRREDYPNGLRIELTPRVFRTHKGDVEKGILGSLVLRNPVNQTTSRPVNFYPNEYSVDTQVFPLDLPDPANPARTVDLFDTLVDDGNLEVVLTCLQRGQFFGVAEPDLYLLPRQGSFIVNFFKGFVSIWLQMLLVVTFGVMWSTFLTGSVAMLATLGIVIGGFFVPELQRLGQGGMMGGGAFESAMRLGRQENMMSELDQTLTTRIIKALDTATQVPMTLLGRVMPNLPALSDVDYVAQGYDIPPNLMAIHFATVLGYIVPVLILGFLFFRAREVAK